MYIINGGSRKCAIEFVVQPRYLRQRFYRVSYRRGITIYSVITEIRILSCTFCY